MLKAENLIWIGEPSRPYDKKYNRWPHYTHWPYKMRFDGEDCDTPFLMGEEEHNVYLAEVEILLKVDALKLTKRRALLDTIEAYGDTRSEAGRREVAEDWAEANAAEGL